MAVVARLNGKLAALIAAGVARAAFSAMYARFNRRIADADGRCGQSAAVADECLKLSRRCGRAAPGGGGRSLRDQAAEAGQSAGAAGRDVRRVARRHRLAQHRAARRCSCARCCPHAGGCAPSGDGDVLRALLGVYRQRDRRHCRPVVARPGGPRRGDRSSRCYLPTARPPPSMKTSCRRRGADAAAERRRRRRRRRRRTRADASPSTALGSRTRRVRTSPCSMGSTSPSLRASASPSSARRALANRRFWRCCYVSTTRRPEGSRSTATVSLNCRRPSCGAASPSCRRSLRCFPVRFGRHRTASKLRTPRWGGGAAGELPHHDFRMATPPPSARTL